mgnify:CR=1 FL=1
MTPWPVSDPDAALCQTPAHVFKRMPYIHWYDKDQYDGEEALIQAVLGGCAFPMTGRRRRQVEKQPLSQQS